MDIVPFNSSPFMREEVTRAWMTVHEPIEHPHAYPRAGENFMRLNIRGQGGTMVVIEMVPGHNFKGELVVRHHSGDLERGLKTFELTVNTSPVNGLCKLNGTTTHRPTFLDLFNVIRDGGYPDYQFFNIRGCSHGSREWVYVVAEAWHHYRLLTRPPPSRVLLGDKWIIYRSHGHYQLRKIIFEVVPGIFLSPSSGMTVTILIEKIHSASMANRKTLLRAALYSDRATPSVLTGTASVSDNQMHHALTLALQTRSRPLDLQIAVALANDPETIDFLPLPLDPGYSRTGDRLINEIQDVIGTNPRPLNWSGWPDTAAKLLAAVILAGGPPEPMYTGA